MPITISFPPSAGIEILSGSNWVTWSSRMLALLRMNALRRHITETKPTADATWDAEEDALLGVLKIYSQKDVWTAVSNDTTFPSCKDKWEELKKIYGGVGSMSAFNGWVALTSTTLDESKPMLPQLQKLSDARNTLQDNEMTITDLQYCFILIKSLPESYSPVASTILATGVPKDLSPLTVQERILNEEGRRSGASGSLNKVAPVRHTNNSHSNVTCFYCRNTGHKANECRKKKRDAAQKEKKEKEKSAVVPAASSSNQAVNAHIVPTTAMITEIDSDNEIQVSLYASARSRWMVDSGATHHITLFRTDFNTWAPATASISLGGHAEISQIGTGDVIVKPTNSPSKV